MLYIKAYVENQLFQPQAIITVYGENHAKHYVSANAVMNDPDVQLTVRHVLQLAKLISAASLILGFIVSSLLTARLLARYGRQQTAKQKLRGSEVASNMALTRALQRFK